MITKRLLRVTDARRCPICGKCDWCGISQDGAIAICMRTPSTKPSKNGGFVHVLRGSRPPLPPPRPIPSRPEKPPPDFEALHHEFREAALKVPERIERLALDLGLPLFTLHWLQVGWSDKLRAYSFPMRNAAGHVIGIHLRTASGRKRCVKRSKLGLFVPNGLDASHKLYLPEGVSDTAAVLAAGLQAVGRPSCSAGTEHVLELVKRHATREVIVVADRDEPGRRGADALAAALAPIVLAVKVIAPPAPHKDLREWISSKLGEGVADAR